MSNRGSNSIMRYFPESGKYRIDDLRREEFLGEAYR